MAEKKFFKYKKINNEKPPPWVPDTQFPPR